MDFEGGEEGYYDPDEIKSAYLSVRLVITDVAATTSRIWRLKREQRKMG